MDNLHISATPPSAVRRERPKSLLPQQTTNSQFDAGSNALPHMATFSKPWAETATQASAAGRAESGGRIRKSGFADIVPGRNSLFDRSSHGRKIKSNSKRFWSEEEDELLRTLVKKLGAKCWKKISGYFDSRTDVQCLHRWQKVLNPALVKGTFS